MKNTIIIIALLLIVVGGGAFFAGVKYQQIKQPRFNRQGASQEIRAGQGQFQGNGARLRPLDGEIIGSDTTSITVKLQDGSSKIILISDKTKINKATEATKEDLKSGEKVMVLGQENSDGSVTAQSIQLNPVLRGQ